MQNGTLFALGIIPFINSFIIMQLLTLVIPKLERLQKEGEEGRKKITQYTRYLAILLGLIQAIGVMFSWRSAIVPVFGDSTASEIFTMICIVIILTAGSSLVMWLGERITEYGIGNGTSLIIFIGIISSLGLSIGNAIFQHHTRTNQSGRRHGGGMVFACFYNTGHIAFLHNSVRRLVGQKNNGAIREKNKREQDVRRTVLLHSH